MPIPERQLQAWANQGAVTASVKTYASVADALDSYSGWREGSSRRWFLQGSYVNHTNVRADGHIDVVALLSTAVRYDTRELNPEQRARVRDSFDSLTYPWQDFRRDVLAALQARYGKQLVQEADKCLEVHPRNLLNVHVVPAVEYRFYRGTASALTYYSGIAFWTERGTMFANFPQQHIDNGAAKDKRTNNRYKPAIRMMKNARTYLVDQGRLAVGVAPSYCIECVLYNCPDACFVDSLSETFLNILTFLYAADFSKFVCQNHLQWLFGDWPWQWSLASGQTFHKEIINLWNNWT